MFGNKGNENATQAPKPQTASTARSNMNPTQKNNNSITAYLGPDVKIEGTLTFESSVLIEGEFKGRIVSEHGQLTIGEKARVEGDLTGGQITIRGHVEGSVNATERVHLADRGELIGDLTTPSLQMDESVTFEGSCKMNGGGKSNNQSNSQSNSQSNQMKSEQENVDSGKEIVDAIHSVS